MTVHAQAYWQQRFAADRQQLEQRRAMGLQQAQAAAVALRQRWSEVQAIQLFGSLLGDGFRAHSDLNLLVAGLPPEAWLEAVALVEACGPLPVDLKRAEDLSPGLLARLRRGSKEL